MFSLVVLGGLGSPADSPGPPGMLFLPKAPMGLGQIDDPPNIVSIRDIFTFSFVLEFTPGLVLSVPSPFLVFRAPLGTRSPGQIPRKSTLPARAEGAGGEGSMFLGFALGSWSQGGPGTPKKGSEHLVRDLV